MDRLCSLPARRWASGRRCDPVLGLNDCIDFDVGDHAISIGTIFAGFRAAEVM